MYQRSFFVLPVVLGAVLGLAVLASRAAGAGATPMYDSTLDPAFVAPAHAGPGGCRMDAVSVRVVAA